MGKKKSPFSFSVVLEAARDAEVLSSIVGALAAQARLVTVAEILVVGGGATCADAGPAIPAESIDEALARATGTHALLLGADLMPSADLLERHRERHGRADRATGILGVVRSCAACAEGPFSQYLELTLEQKSECGGDGRAGEPRPNALPARGFRRENFSAPLETLRAVGGIDGSLPSVCNDVETGVRLAGLGVPVFCDFHALATRTSPMTFEEMESIHAAQGAAYPAVCLRHPEHFSIEEAMDECHAGFVDADPAEVAKWRELMGRVERHPRWREMRIDRQDPVGGRTSIIALFSFYDRLLRYAEGRGMHDALVRLVGEDWVARFRASVGVLSAKDSYIPVLKKEAVDAARAGRSDGAPLVSVIIPVRNGEAKLARTLETFRNQTIPRDRIEIVCVDDGSTDGTPALLEAAAARGELRWFRQEAAGQSAATNRGIVEARGEYLFLTASDILAAEDLLARHLETHASSDDELFVLGYLPYAKEIEVTPFMEFITRDGTQFGYNLIQYRDKLSPRFTYAPNLSLRREALRRAGLFDESFVFGVQDIELGVRVRLAGLKMVFDEKAVGYHNHPVSFRSFLDYRQPMAGRGTVLYSRKWPSLCPPHLLKNACVDEYWRFRESDLAERVEDLIARVEGMEEGARPVLCTEAPLATSHMPILPFLYRWICKYHFGRGVFEAFVEDEGENWPDRAIAGGRCFAPVFPEMDDLLRTLSKLVSSSSVSRGPVEVARRQTQRAILFQSPDYYTTLRYREFNFKDGLGG